MKVTLSPCFILHQRPYRETSLLVDVFSREHGRLRLVAKGARNSKKWPAALFQVARNLNVSWSGKGELATLTDIEATRTAFDINGSCVMAVFYMNELLVRLLHSHEPHAELFEAYVMALTRLEHGESESVTLRYFERQLLDSIGYGLVLDHDIQDGCEISPEKEYHYFINQGAQLDAGGTGTSIRISGATLLALADESLDENTNTVSLKNLMRSTLGTYLGDEPLKSRELYRQYSQFAPG